MKILHTSDWHLGRMLYSQKRYEEFEAFLLWFNGFIEQQMIDVLLVAGDIFDTTTPSNKAQEMYYQFLSRTMQSCCRHVVVVGGNHDSPTLLNAPKDLLRALNVHIVGEMTENIEDEVITLRDKAGKAEVIVCAVPFLRDRDVRQVEAAESIDDKVTKLNTGIAQHYQKIGQLAEMLKKEVANIPIVGMGHLFTTGGTVTEGDGTRDLYVGTALKVEKNIFPACFDYLALGHLHIAQTVGSENSMRYSGSPIPMGFNEANQQKKLIVIEFDERGKTITEHLIPTFQPLVQVKGNIEKITARISDLKATKSNAWLEVECTEMDLAGSLNEMVNEATKDTDLKVLRLKNKQIENRILSRTDEAEELGDLEPTDVFERLLDAQGVANENRDALWACYREILAELENNDVNAN